MTSTVKNNQKQAVKPNRQAQNSRSTKERRPRQIWLHVFPRDTWVPAERGETIFSALQKANVDIASDCGGIGKCGKCKIKVLSVVDPPTTAGKKLLDKDLLQRGFRLACQTKADRDLAISVGKADTELDYLKILTTSHVIPARYIQISELEPLIDLKLVTLPTELQDGNVSDLDWVRLGLGDEYSGLQASIHFTA
jgi:ferredoxin